MGGNFWSHTTTWTFLCCLVQMVDGDRSLLQDLGLDALPDVTKINISQTEYTNMMSAYLQQLQVSSDANSIPKLFTFDSERKYWRRRKDNVIRLKFPVKSAEQKMDVDNAELRLLAPPLPGQEIVKVKILQVLGAHRRRMLQEREIYVSPTRNKWFEFDVTEAVRSWVDGERNLGIELECTDCGYKWRPLQAAISALIHPEPSRFRRSAMRSYENPNRRTDCIDRPNDKQKRSKCCRHMMTVTFKDLDLPNMEFIVQPKQYEAGFCRGRCPLNYNHATNHSRIQSLVHRHNKTMPKVCCTPSKLEPLEILRINPHDTQKLKIEKWDNMRVLECACS